MATEKPPQNKVLFTKEVTRFMADADAQLDIFGNPQVQTVIFTVTATWCPQIKVMRTYVGGAKGGYRQPIAIDGGDYEATVAAMVDVADAEAPLPGYGTAEEAKDAWKLGKRERWSLGEHAGDGPDGE